MNLMRIARQFALFASALALVASAEAQPAETRPMVEWIVPALSTNKPQTEQEAKEGQLSGRALPPAEILQPILDPALPVYQPRKEKLTGSFKGASSDVLKVLVEKWFAKFKTYHPEVTL